MNIELTTDEVDSIHDAIEHIKRPKPSEDDLQAMVNDLENVLRHARYRLRGPSHPKAPA
jgi:hypothetical protein